MQVIVCGSRSTTPDQDNQVAAYLDEVCKARPISMLIHGGASGVDRAAETWARAAGIRTRHYLAEWSVYGNAAGPIRNSKMAAALDPTGVVIAFPGGRGTASMVAEAELRGLKVVRPEWKKDER